jgi:hypothetical protein
MNDSIEKVDRKNERKQRFKKKNGLKRIETTALVGDLGAAEIERLKRKVEEQYAQVAEEGRRLAEEGRRSAEDVNKKLSALERRLDALKRQSKKVQHYFVLFLLSNIFPLIERILS